MQGSLAVAGTEVEGIQEKLGATLNMMVETVLPPLIKGLEVVADWFGQLVAAVQPFVPIVEQLVTQYLSALADAFNQIAAVLLDKVVPVIVSVAKAVLPALTAALRWLADDVLPSVTNAFKFIASHVMPLITSAVGWITKNVLPPLGAAFGWIVKNVLPPVVAAFKWIADNVLPAIGTAFAFLTDKVIPAIATAFQAVGSVIGKVFGAITGTVKSAINAVIGIVNGMIRAIDSVQFHVHIDPPDPLPKIHFDWNGVGIGQLPYLHSGGLVPGTPGADVLAVLQAGERVLPRGSVSPPTVVVNINGGLIDGPTIDALTNALARRLSFAPGT
jgi:phage-related protein